MASNLSFTIVMTICCLAHVNILSVFWWFSTVYLLSNVEFIFLAVGPTGSLAPLIKWTLEDILATVR